MAVAYVAGAAGAIGRHCVALLRARGWTVGGLGHGNPVWNGEDAAGIDCWIAGDVGAEALDLLALRLGPPDLLVNLAGGSSVGPSLSAPLGDFARTVTTGVEILNWVWRHAPEARVAFASSAAVYGDAYDRPIRECDATLPLSPYGHHKLMMEANARFWGQCFGLNAVVVRLFSVYGSGLRKQLIHDLSTKLSRGPKEIVLSGTGAEMRDWLWIGDAARMLIDAASLASPEVPVFNGCTGVPTPIREIATQLARLWGGRTTARFDGISRPGDPIHLHGDPASLASHGIRAEVALADGLARTAARWRDGLEP
jgi:UDP-glucose 4-epimerase